MEGFECCLVLPKILRRRCHCREPTTNKHVHHAMRPAALFFNGAVGNALNPRIRKLFMPPASNINVSTEVWPQGRSAPDSHSAYPRRHNHLQTMTDQCGVFADHNQASALFRSTLQLFSFLLVFSIPAISSFSPSLLPSLPPTSSHQPQPFPFPLPKRSNTLQSDMRQTSQTYPPFLPSSSFSTPDFCRMQEPTPSGRPTPNPCEAPATRT
jgi:hypothetical protein